MPPQAVDYVRDNNYSGYVYIQLQVLQERHLLNLPVVEEVWNLLRVHVT